MKSGETEFRVSNDGQARNSGSAKGASQNGERAVRPCQFARIYPSFPSLVLVGLAAVAWPVQARGRRVGRTLSQKNAAVIVCGPLISLLSAKWRGRAVAARRGRGDSGGVSQRVGGGGSSKGLREYYVARQSFAW